MMHWQFGSIWQVREQQSPLTVFPSSQGSFASTFALPHFGPALLLEDVLEEKLLLEHGVDCH